MSVWVLHQPVEHGQETQLLERPHVIIPWQGIPNLAGIHSQRELMKLVQQLMPDAPPETLSLKSQVVWDSFSQLHKEDIIAVPLPQTNQIALAEVTGGYEYQAAQVGRPAQHVYPVRWHGQLVPLARFGAHVSRLCDESVPLWQVENDKLRGLIRDQLPLGYNRFRYFKWLLAVAFVLHLINFLINQLGGQGH